MGTWRFKLEADDTAADVLAAFDSYLKEGRTVLDATAKTREQFKSVLKDEDDGPIVILALAKAQWRYGPVDKVLIEAAREVIRTGAGLSRWNEAGVSNLQKRTAALASFDLSPNVGPLLS
jgi:hypothetical protein